MASPIVKHFLLYSDKTPSSLTQSTSSSLTHRHPLLYIKYRVQSSLCVDLLDLIGLDLELEDCSRELDADGLVGQEGEIFLQTDQSAELGLGVGDVEVPVLQNYLGMLP